MPKITELENKLSNIQESTGGNRPSVNNSAPSITMVSNEQSSNTQDINQSLRTSVPLHNLCARLRDLK